MAFLREVMDFIKEHWDTVALAATWLGIVVLYFRRRGRWHRKQFLEQVNFSLNYFQDDCLVMRTLLETSASQVWLNEFGVTMVMAAAQKATPEQPFILLSNPKDMQFINRAVLNAVSERYSETFIAKALGKSVDTATFCYAITCEKYQEMRTLKLRVLLIREQSLLEDFAPGAKGDTMEIDNPVYMARLRTLRMIYQLYQQDQQSANPVLGRVELGLPG